MSNQIWLKLVQNISRTVSMIISKFELMPPMGSFVIVGSDEFRMFTNVEYFAHSVCTRALGIDSGTLL